MMRLNLKKSNAASRRFRLLFASCTAALCLLVVAPSAFADCANADLVPVTTHELGLAGRAADCLVNQARTRYGRVSLKWSRSLRRASAAQAVDMFTYGYFDHQRPDGPDFVARIASAGYGRHSSGSSLGENIEWSTADQATPREAVKAWLGSPGHRENIMRRVFRDGAIAAVRSQGFDSGDFGGVGPVVVYVSEFGRRY